MMHWNNEISSKVFLLHLGNTLPDAWNKDFNREPGHAWDLELGQAYRGSQAERGFPRSSRVPGVSKVGSPYSFVKDFCCCPLHKGVFTN